jgi:hypothetical protein
VSRIERDERGRGRGEQVAIQAVGTALGRGITALTLFLVGAIDYVSGKTDRLNRSGPRATPRCSA